MEKSIKIIAERRSLKVVASEFFPAGTTDFSSDDRAGAPAAT